MQFRYLPRNRERSNIKCDSAKRLGNGRCACFSAYLSWEVRLTRKICYFAVFEPGKDGTYSVYFPDLPGCVSYGETLEEAKRQAVDALTLHVYGMEQDGDPLPAPSVTPEIDPETAPGFVVAPVVIYPDWDNISTCLFAYR